MRAMDDPTDEPDRRPALTLIRGGRGPLNDNRARIKLDHVRTRIAPEWHDEAGCMGVVAWWEHPRAFITMALTPEGAYSLGEALQTAALAAGWEP